MPLKLFNDVSQSVVYPFHWNSHSPKSIPWIFIKILVTFPEIPPKEHSLEIDQVSFGSSPYNIKLGVTFQYLTNEHNWLLAQFLGFWQMCRAVSRDAKFRKCVYNLHTTVRINQTKTKNKSKRGHSQKNRRISSKQTFLFCHTLMVAKRFKPLSTLHHFFGFGCLYWKLSWNNFLGFCCYKSSSESKINVCCCFELLPTRRQRRRRRCKSFS